MEKVLLKEDNVKDVIEKKYGNKFDELIYIKKRLLKLQEFNNLISKNEESKKTK